MNSPLVQYRLFRLYAELLWLPPFAAGEENRIPQTDNRIRPDYRLRGRDQALPVLAGLLQPQSERLLQPVVIIKATERWLL